MLLTEEGYVTFATSGTPTYHYYLKDHLGNVRIVMRQDGTVEQRNQYYPDGTLFGKQSTGGTVQPYKFGAKELERTLPLDEYDFGARWMDPVVGARFGTMDPLAEKYPWISPYAYCGGDPVNAFDPDGRIIIPWFLYLDEKGNNVGQRNCSNLLFQDAMTIFGQTSYGNHMISSFLPLNSTQYGVKGNGVYSNYEMEIDVGGYGTTLDKYIAVGDTEGSFRITNENNRLKFVFFVNTSGKTKVEVLETIVHEFALHGSEVFDLIDIYEKVNQAGGDGFEAAKAYFNRDPLGNKDHENLSRHNMNDKASSTYIRVMEEIMQAHPEYKSIFEREKQKYSEK